jgi:hypothetical protein
MDRTIADPVALVDALEPAAIRARIADLERQSRALRVLLRAAVARERRARPASGASPDRREVRDGDR